MNNNLWIIPLIAAAIITPAIIWRKLQNQYATKKGKVSEQTLPAYTKKPSIMTDREAQFFRTLQAICNDHFYIVPQAHLSLFLSEKVHGQNWRAAFQRINGKSVDFLVCKKSDNSAVIAIELDDTTHDTATRTQRDTQVNTILQGAGVPILRTRNANISDSELREQLRALLTPNHSA